MSGVGPLPAPLRYTVEAGDTGAQRPRQFDVMRGGASQVGYSLASIAIGLAYAAVVYVGFTALIPDPLPGETMLLAGLTALGVSIGGLSQWALNRLAASRMLSALDARIAASAAGGAVIASLDEDALTIASDAGVTTRCAYAAMSRVEQDAVGAFVWIGADLILHVPRRAFENDDALAAWTMTVDRLRSAAEVKA